jgi:hypothetical protein
MRNLKEHCIVDVMYHDGEINDSIEDVCDDLCGGTVVLGVEYQSQRALDRLLIRRVDSYPAPFNFPENLK